MKAPPPAWVFLILRCLVGGVFIYAGALKIRDPQAFADSIATFQLLPMAVINPLAIVLPPFEILVGLALMLGWWKRAMSLAVMILLAVFLVALASALARGLQVDCGCFGSGPPSAWKTWYALGRDVLLLGGAWILHRREWRAAGPA